MLVWERKIAMIPLLKAILRGKKYIIIFTVAAFVTSAGASLVIPPKYTSTTVFMPIGVEKEITGLRGFFSQLGAFGEAYSTYLRARKNYVIDFFVRSRRMSDLMNKRFDLEKVYRVNNAEEVKEELRRRTGVMIRDEGVIVLSVDDRDPTRARDMVSAYLAYLDTLLIDMNSSYAAERVRFLEGEIARRKRVVSRDDSMLAQFQKRYSLYDMQKQARAVMDLVSALSSRLSILDTEKKLLEMAMLPDVPELRSIDAEMARIEEQLAAIKNEGLDVKGRTKLFPSLNELPELSQKYVKLLSDIKMQEFAIGYLKLRLEDAKLSADKRVSVLKILDPPVVPERRSWPKRKQIVLFSTMAVFFWTAMVLLVIEEFRKSY